MSPGAALIPLRAFLGGTFVYAGVQKLSDPGFLHPGAPTYIGTQLRGFADGTPGGWLLRTFAIPHPALAGIAVAVIEIAVGLLVLLGLGTRVAALVGLSLNLVLFLTNSWHTSPYFLGSDIVFVFAWLPFVLAGAAGQPALDHGLARRSHRRGVPPAAAALGARTRGEALVAAYTSVAALTGIVAGVSAALKGSAPQRPRASSTSTPRPKRHARRPRRRSSRHSGGVPAGAVRLGRSSQLPAGQAALYQDPADGQTDIVVRLAGGRLAAASAICTHAGCRVQFAQGALYCPCHGSVFNVRTGAVEQGPAQAPLPVKRVTERAGWIYALRS